MHVYISVWSLSFYKVANIQSWGLYTDHFNPYQFPKVPSLNTIPRLSFHILNSSQEIPNVNP
jgi:hypothetical protein